jgi:hypothetical protein
MCHHTFIAVDHGVDKGVGLDNSFFSIPGNRPVSRLTEITDVNGTGE